MTSKGKTALVPCVFAVVAALCACRGAAPDDGIGPDQGIGGEVRREDVTRSFSAVTFASTTDGATTDHLAQGAMLDIILHEDGTTTGRLFMPGAREGGGDLDVDLASTFSFNDTTDRVTFDQSTDTFARDMAFTAVRAGDAVQLEGQRGFGSTTVRLVLG